MGRPRRVIALALSCALLTCACGVRTDAREMDLNLRLVLGFAHLGCRHQKYFDAKIALTEWNTFTQEWGPGFRRYYLDGGLVGQSTQRVYRGPERWQLQTEAHNRPGDDTSGHLMVDGFGSERRAAPRVQSCDRLVLAARISRGKPPPTRRARRPRRCRMRQLHSDGCLARRRCRSSPEGVDAIRWLPVGKSPRYRRAPVWRVVDGSGHSVLSRLSVGRARGLAVVVPDGRRGDFCTDGGVSPTDRGRVGSARRSRAIRTFWCRSALAGRLW